MKPRAKKRPPVHKGQVAPSPPLAQHHTFPAPIRGWVLSEPLSLPTPGGALHLDNWVCTTTGIRVRGGTEKVATIGGAVTTLFNYKSTSELFFAADETNIHDITAVSDVAVAPTPLITGQTSGRYATEQFGTAGGDYLYAVNGTDDALLFDGTSFTAINATTTPAITGVDSDTLSHVWSFANRLFFVKKNTMRAFYLPVDSIGGAADEFSLAGIFKRGGSLLFGATWSLDAGDGLDDKCVFISTEGEVAVYEGTNPGNAATWSKVGVYQITRPLGSKAIMQAGGDLLVATEAGMVAVSQAINNDSAALSMKAVSADIGPYWQKQAVALSSIPWEVIKWPTKNMMVISQPGHVDDVGTCLVANMQTGAWSRFTGLQTRCLGFFDGSGYFGNDQGEICKMEVGGSDNGAVYTASYLGQHEDIATGGRQKTVTMMRPVFQGVNEVAPLVTVKVDYVTTLDDVPAISAIPEDPVWDSAVWDDDVWDSRIAVSNSARWFSVGRTGRTIAPEIQISLGSDAFADVEMASIDVQFQVGAVVT